MTRHEAQPKRHRGIEISGGWYISDIETLADCEEAYIELSTSLANIKGQLDDFASLPEEDKDYDWFSRTLMARRYKTVALKQVELIKDNILAVAANSSLEHLTVDRARLAEEAIDYEREKSRLANNESNYVSRIADRGSQNSNENSITQRERSTTSEN